MDQCNHGVGAESIEMRRRLRVGPRPDPEEKHPPNHRGATALPAPTTDDSAGQQGLYGRHLSVSSQAGSRLHTLSAHTVSLIYYFLDIGSTFSGAHCEPLVTSCHLRHV